MSMNDDWKTRCIALSPRIERVADQLSRTIVPPVLPVALHGRYRELYERHQERIAAVLLGERRSGVALFAVSAAGELVGELWLKATEELRAGLVGRHMGVDLPLPAAEGMSLRQFVLLTRSVDGVPTVRLLDLDTPLGLFLEGAGRIHAAEARGPLFCHAAGHLFFIFPTGESAPWTDEASLHWSALPPRAAQQIDESSPEPPPRLEDTVIVRESLVSIVDLPARSADEPPAGYLELRRGHIEERIAVGAKALRRGLLLGRYGRCHGGRVLDTDRVSRVHALLIEDDEMLHIVDTGSTNGTWLGEEELKCAVLPPNTAVTLSEYVELRWSPVH